MSATLTPQTWSPSAARTIPLWDYPAGAPVGKIAPSMPLRWPDKLAGETLDFTLDASSLLAFCDDPLTALVGSGSLSLVAQLVRGGLVTLWLSGGAAGTDNAIDLQLATGYGRAVHRVVRLLTL